MNYLMVVFLLVTSTCIFAQDLSHLDTEYHYFSRERRKCLDCPVKRTEGKLRKGYAKYSVVNGSIVMDLYIDHNEFLQITAYYILTDSHKTEEGNAIFNATIVSKINGKRESGYGIIQYGDSMQIIAPNLLTVLTYIR